MAMMQLKGEKRTGSGKSVTRKLRRQGNIPAVLYGKDTEALSLSIVKKDWEKLARQLKRTTIFELQVDANGGAETRTVMVKSIQRVYPAGHVIHIDFLQVSMERMVEVEIPVHLVGEAKGVKLGGIAELHLRTVSAECLPAQIPEMIEIDISTMNMGDSIHISDVQLPGVKFLDGGDVAIVTLIHPEAGEKTAAEEGSSEPERIEKKKE